MQEHSDPTQDQMRLSTTSSTDYKMHHSQLRHHHVRQAYQKNKGFFTTDQERTAYILQREANTSRSSAVHNITAMTLRDDQRIEDLRRSQAAAFAALTELLQQNVKTIKENENLINQMVNPNIGRSKQTLDPPVLVPAPIGHKPHHSVMNTSTLKDNIFVFNPSDANADIVRTWDQMKQYGTKQFFTEEDYITAWTKVTSGDALQQLHNMIHSKYSLTRILKFWEELYSKTRSITDQQEIIDSFRRKKNKRSWQQCLE
jgi:hypothetical protein